uniref:LSM7 homolog, U6 small nuclear RNA and mRNA degradation associated n=1 Tax=Suricata suricatta TaxID=37032 RepID=A0A673TT20_SURSU
ARGGPAGRAARDSSALCASRALLSLQDKEKKKKESILDLSKYIDKTIRVKFQGGREASGILKGFDPLLNLVLDGTVEYMRGSCAPVSRVFRWTLLLTTRTTSTS